MKKIIALVCIILFAFSPCLYSGEEIVDGIPQTPSANITGGTINGTTIGDETPAAGNFTALTGKRTASAVDYNPSALTTDYIIAITNTDAARAVLWPIVPL